jgi:Flp pilus assembly protein CpaB
MAYRVRNLGLAFVLAAAAVAIVSVYVSQVRRDASSGGASVTVYVAKSDIGVGTPGAEIAAHLLVPVSVPRRDVVPGAISDPGQIADSVLTQQIYKKEQVTVSRFASREGGVRSRISGNQRIIAVAGTPQQTLAGTLADGDRVDVVASWQSPEGATPAHHLSRVLLRNLLVVAAPSTVVSKTGSSIVELRMTDLEVEKFFWLVENGAWSLVLRPPAGAAASSGQAHDAVSIALGQIAGDAKRGDR